MSKNWKQRLNKQLEQITSPSEVLSSQSQTIMFSEDTTGLIYKLAMGEQLLESPLYSNI